MEFKGTKEKWKCIFTSELKRAIRSEGGILMTFWKPTKYSGQDKRYDQELKETQANQLLCSKAPEMLEMLQKIVKSYDFQNENKYYNPEIEQARKLIKEATEL
jgi:hypothetical protein